MRRTSRRRRAVALELDRAQQLSWLALVKAKGDADSTAASSRVGARGSGGGGGACADGAATRKRAKLRDGLVMLRGLVPPRAQQLLVDVVYACAAAADLAAGAHSRELANSIKGRQAGVEFSAHLGEFSAHLGEFSAYLGEFSAYLGDFPSPLPSGFDRIRRMLPPPMSQWPRFSRLLRGLWMNHN